MLVREKQKFGRLGESPLECARGVGRCADHALTFSTKSFDRRGGIHVRNRCNACAGIISQAGSNQLLPAILYLRDFRHVGHGASGVEIRKNGDLPRAAEDVGTLGHEVHATENDVFSIRHGSLLRKPVRVAAEIGVANDLIALIVMSKDDAVATQSLASRTNALVHSVIGQNEIIFQTANWSCRSQCHVSAFSFGYAFAAANAARGKSL